MLYWIYLLVKALPKESDIGIQFFDEQIATNPESLKESKKHWKHKYSSVHFLFSVLEVWESEVRESGNAGINQGELRKCLFSFYGTLSARQADPLITGLQAQKENSSLCWLTERNSGCLGGLNVENKCSSLGISQWNTDISLWNENILLFNHLR